jgi:hypothetical protein
MSAVASLIFTSSLYFSLRVSGICRSVPHVREYS